MPALHAGHAPSHDFSDGYPPVPYPEVPQRVEAVLHGLQRIWPAQPIEVAGQALEAVRALHDADYVEFLLAIAETLQPGDEYIPTVFHPDLGGAPLRHRGGMYCAEIGSPLVAGTVEAALCSAAAAVAAAEAVAESGEDAIALCRPPGHHAGRRRWGGYCLFNNAYLAAHRLAAAGICPVLDVDYHLGDGGLEFASEQAPYFSLHADPWRNYPHLDARAGREAGPGALVVLPRDTDDAEYLELLDPVLARIDSLEPTALVVSLGFDIATGDGIQDDPVHIGPEGFHTLGRRIGRRPFPVVVLLEGGYDLEALPERAADFFAGLRDGRAD
ncbi:acetylpolyamine aminohydrolase [Sediminicurvatus halobius]|uniref:acetylpolyamine aminohydrolase n=1 Tax=Sediminicurvatus halobius TaxID=2182432 RepID=UPI001E4A32FC|nr:acetylpolyamine aminohydrolase [Spiribacter halobius]UEX76710.1 acetylpolyamine aminohydrolase [Spiribacter halobius]